MRTIVTDFGVQFQLELATFPHWQHFRSSFGHPTIVTLPRMIVRQNVFRTNGPYFQNKIEKVPFESRQVKKSPIRRKYDAIFVFPNGR